MTVKIRMGVMICICRRTVVCDTGRSAQVFVLDGKHHTAKAFGAEQDIVKVNVLENCVIDLSQVF